MLVVAWEPKGFNILEPAATGIPIVIGKNLIDFLKPLNSLNKGVLSQFHHNMKLEKIFCF